MKTRGNPYLFSLLITAAAMSNASLGAAELSLNGTGTVRLLASDWSDYLGGSGSFNSANDWGRVFWRGTSGDGQYIHFDLTRLSGLTVSSAASVTLQNANPTWGGSVDNSFIATANGAWTAGSGTSIPGATAIGDATNATGSYSSGASVTWGIGSATFQGYINNASSFNGLAIIGGNGSTLHFTGPTNPYLEVATNANMTGVITVSDDTNWTGKYSFTNGVLSVNDSVSGGNVVINSLGTVAVTEGAYNRYWDVSSTRINSGGVLTIQGHSHLRNLTLAGGELAGIRPDGTYGGWILDDATTVTGGVTSTISAQRIALDNGTFAVDAGSTLNMTGSIASGSITKNGPGLMRLLSSGMSGTPVNRHTGATVINGGTLEIYGRSADNGGFTSLGTGSVTINNGGTLITANDWALGNEWNGGNVGTVTVNAGGTLTINSAGNTIRNGLVLNGGTVNGSGANTDWGGIYLKSTTVTAGGNAISTISVDTALDTTITMSVNSGSQLNYSGNLRDKIGSTGGIAKSGAGTLTLSGANNYTGVTNVNVGSLKLAKNSALYNGSTGSWTAANVKIASGATLALNVGGTGEFNSSHVTTLLTNLGGANGTSSAGFAAGSFIAFDTTNAPQGNFTVADSISDSTGTGGGALGVTKLGSGTLTLSSTNTYTGATNVNGGQLVVNGNISTSNVTVASGASIGGSGTVGALTVNAGGTVAPGNSPGILNTGDYNQAGTLVAEITGLVAGSGHDQINVMGTVNLSGALDLQFSASQDYVLNSMIFLILNNGSDAVTGTFTGLAQGATAATFGGFDWVISYTANSTDTTFTGGNDVALMAIPEPSTALLGGLGVLGLLRRRRK